MYINPLLIMNNKSDRLSKYINVIEKQLLLDTKDMTFKSDPIYCEEVLENIDPGVGKVYLNLIVKHWGEQFINNISLFQQLVTLNDSIGNPKNIITY